MIGLDINVIVRVLVADDPAQLRAAARLLAEHESEDAMFYLDDLALVEACWVLRRVYSQPEPAIHAAFAALVSNRAFAFEDRPRLQRVLERCARSSTDFADTLLTERHRSAGCSATATFDKGMKTLPGVRLL